MGDTNHPLSAPALRKLQSPLTTQSQPPATPLPLLQSGAAVPVRRILVPGARAAEDEEVPDGSPGCRLTNLDNPAVKTLKSSTFGSSGMCPVSARPIAINGAAWEHIKIALLDLSAGDWVDSTAAISASTSAIIPARAVARRSWSCAIVSPRVEGWRCGV